MNLFFNIKTAIGLVKYIEYIYPVNNNNMLIEPISCICKLALLYFYPIDTKISIGTYNIQLQKPKILTPVKRFYNCDGKDDIGLLFFPIIKFIEWYIEWKDTSDTERIKELTEIIKYATKGLDVLKKTYQQDKKNKNVMFTIQLYIEYLTKCYSGDMTSDMVKKIYLQNTIDTGTNSLHGDTDELKIIDSNILKKQFPTEILKTITTILDLCNKSKDLTSIRSYTKSILSIVDDQDTKYRKLIKNTLNV